MQQVRGDGPLDAGPGPATFVRGTPQGGCANRGLGSLRTLPVFGQASAQAQRYGHLSRVWKRAPNCDNPPVVVDARFSQELTRPSRVFLLGARHVTRPRSTGVGQLAWLDTGHLKQMGHAKSHRASLLFGFPLEAT